VRGRGERKQRRGGPAEEECNWVSEQRPDPTEVSPYIAVAVELRVALGGECAGEKDSEEKQDDPADLAGERRLRVPIVPVPARAS
jgi:hypothetical protein